MQTTNTISVPVSCPLCGGHFEDDPTHSGGPTNDLMHDCTRCADCGDSGTTSHCPIGGGDWSDPQLWVNLERPKHRVARILRAISSKFGSAALLAQAVAQKGLFHGRVSWVESHWDEELGWVEGSWRIEETVSTEPWAEAQDGWAFPSFNAGIAAGGSNWACMVGFGTHYVTLIFDEEGGLYDFIVDTLPSSRCWSSPSALERGEEILSLVAPVWPYGLSGAEKDKNEI